jgi:hypothetical protein
MLADARRVSLSSFLQCNSGPETPFLWSLLLNVVLIILLTGLVELICVPLLQLAAVKEIDSNSAIGRLLVSFLAAFLFVGGVRGAVVLFVSLIVRWVPALWTPHIIAKNQ